MDLVAKACVRRALLLVWLLASVSLAQAPRTRPFAQDEVQQLLASGVPNGRIVTLIEQVGIEFEPTDEALAAFQSAGADDKVLAAVRLAGAKWHVRRGWDFRAKSQGMEAEQEARAALRLAPDLPDAHLLLAEAFWVKEDFDGALAEYREVVRRQSDSAAGHTGTCGALFIKSELDAAVAECREALRLEPNRLWAHLWLGNTLVMKGDTGGALAEFRAGLRIDPASPDAHIGSCWALRAMGDTDGALTECREALKLNPQHPWAHFHLAETFMAKSDFAAAEAEYREALRLKPDFFSAKVGVCWAQASKNELDAAFAVCQEAVKQKPADPWVHNLLGFIWEKKGNAAAALEEYRAAFLALPQNPIIKGNYERLLQQSQQKANLGQRLARAQQLLGQGASAQAEQQFRAILQQEPANRNARFGLGDALQAQARYKEASAEYLAASHGPALFRVNTGGAYKDSQGCVWERDKYYDKGYLYRRGGGIAGTADSPLFNVEHANKNLLGLGTPFEYRFPVANGEYRVNLYLAEIWDGFLLIPSAQAPGRRIFSIAVNGQTIFPNLDVFAEIGGHTAEVKSVRVRVADGVLRVRFLPVFDIAKIGAIEVIGIE